MKITVTALTDAQERQIRDLMAESEAISIDTRRWPHSLCFLGRSTAASTGFDR